MNKYGVLAIDLAKTVFQVCKTDSFGNVIDEDLDTHLFE